MIMYLITHSILLIKLILFIFVKLFLLPNVFSKYILLILLIFCIYLLLKAPRKRFKKLSKLKKAKRTIMMTYELKPSEHVYNIFIISFMITSYLALIFYLRYSNKDKTLDLLEKYNLIKDLLYSSTLFDIFFNLILFILFFILYLLVMIKIIKYFKFEIMRRHLYLVGSLDRVDTDNWYQLSFFHGFLYKIILNKITLGALLRKIYEKCYFRFQNKKYPANMNELGYMEQGALLEEPPVDPRYFTFEYRWVLTYTFHLFTKGHYILLGLLLLYDLWFNNFNLSLVFAVLPWIFFYDIYVRVSKFINDLYLPHDSFMHTIIYGKYMEFWDEKTLYIDGGYYDLADIKRVYQNYMLKGFVKDYNDM